MASFRCSNCNLNWQPNNANTRCGRCGGKTSHMSSVTPMTHSEEKHVRFEVFYEAREAKRAEEWAKTVTPEAVCEGMGE